MKPVIFTVLLAFTLVACSKTTNPEWMVYYETSCLPEWVIENSDSKTKKELSNYLKDNGVIPLRIKIEGERIPTCNYCDCSTGKIYYVQIDKSQIEYLSWYGFEKK